MGLHRTTIELDSDKLAEVAAVLGTKGIKPTVDAAFDQVLRTGRVGRSVTFFAEMAARDDLTERDRDVALTHLLDTSVLTTMNRPGVAKRVLDLAAVGAVGRTRMTDLEMGAQARNAGEWDRIAVEADAYPLVPIGPAAFDRALAVQRLLADKSQRGRKLPDLLIAAVAEEAGLIVLHHDADFDRIAAVTGQPCEWVAPAKSAD